MKSAQLTADLKAGVYQDRHHPARYTQPSSAPTMSRCLLSAVSACDLPSECRFRCDVARESLHLRSETALKSDDGFLHYFYEYFYIFSVKGAKKISVYQPPLFFWSIGVGVPRFSCDERAWIFLAVFSFTAVVYEEPDARPAFAGTRTPPTNPRQVLRPPDLCAPSSREASCTRRSRRR